MTRTYWIQAFPQKREAGVCWLTRGMQPVCDPQTRHLSAWHGPYKTADKANESMVRLFYCYDTLRPFRDEDADVESAIAAAEARVEEGPNPARGERYAH